MGFPCGSAGKESICNAGDLGLIPGMGRAPGERKGYPLQYSGLENFMDSPWVPKRVGHDWVTFTFHFHFLFSFAFHFFSQLFVRPPQTTILPFCISFSWGWFWAWTVRVDSAELKPGKGRARSFVTLKNEISWSPSLLNVPFLTKTVQNPVAFPWLLCSFPRILAGPEILFSYKFFHHASTVNKTENAVVLGWGPPATFHWGIRTWVKFGPPRGRRDRRHPCEDETEWVLFKGQGPCFPWMF